MREVERKTDSLFSRFMRCEEGATAIEYAMIATAVGLALTASLPTIRTGIGLMYDDILGYFASI